MKHLISLIIITLTINNTYSQKLKIRGLVDPKFIKSEKIFFFNFDSKKMNAKKYIKVTDSIVDGEKFNAYEITLPSKKVKNLFLYNYTEVWEDRCVQKIDITKLINLTQKQKISTVNSDIIVDYDCLERMYNASPDAEKIANKYSGTYEYIENGIKKEIRLNEMFDSYYKSDFVNANLMNSANGKWFYSKEENKIKMILNYETNNEIGIKKMLFLNTIIEINISTKGEKEILIVNNIELVKKI